MGVTASKNAPGNAAEEVRFRLISRQISAHVRRTYVRTCKCVRADDLKRALYVAAGRTTDGRTDVQLYRD